MKLAAELHDRQPRFYFGSKNAASNSVFSLKNAMSIEIALSSV
jgi:hypothetical protein